MAALYCPTSDDRDRIRRAAALEAELQRPTIVLEVGRRINLADGRRAINIATISTDPEFADTDLDDYEPWPAFARGVQLTEAGDGIFDFYIRRRGDRDRELRGNVTVHIAAGKIIRIHGYPGEY